MFKILHAQKCIITNNCFVCKKKKIHVTLYCYVISVYLCIHLFLQEYQLVFFIPAQISAINRFHGVTRYILKYCCLFQMLFIK